MTAMVVSSTALEHLVDNLEDHEEPEAKNSLQSVEKGQESTLDVQADILVLLRSPSHVRELLGSIVERLNDDREQVMASNGPGHDKEAKEVVADGGVSQVLEHLGDLERARERKNPIT